MPFFLDFLRLEDMIYTSGFSNTEENLRGKKMDINRKQKFSLLCGVVALVLGAFNALFDFYHPGFDIYLVTVTLITAGSFYALRDKKDKNT